MATRTSTPGANRAVRGKRAKSCTRYPRCDK